MKTVLEMEGGTVYLCLYSHFNNRNLFMNEDVMVLPDFELSVQYRAFIVYLHEPP